MPDRSPENERPENTKRSKRLLWSVITIVLAVALCGLLLRVLLYESVDEKLAAIDAAHAIPYSQNAATIYLQLFADYNESEVNPAFLTPPIQDITNKMPWASKDYPELAKWIHEHQKPIVEKMIQASKLEDCYFQISLPYGYEIRIQNLRIIRKLVYMVIISANNDIAEGRLDEALEKYSCCIHSGRHFRQQPLAIDFLVGNAMEAFGLQKIRYLIMHDDATEEHLKTIETILLDTKFQLDEYWEVMLHVENLYAGIMPQTPSSSNLLTRLKEWWQNRGNFEAAMNRVHELYLRLLADRRGSQILVALRRYKNKTGRWPENLDDIKPIVAEEILIDPQNKNSFVYKLSGDNFILYSKGLDNIDESGRYKGGADDWPIWPTRHMNSKTQKEDTNDR